MYMCAHIIYKIKQVSKRNSPSPKELFSKFGHERSIVYSEGTTTTMKDRMVGGALDRGELAEMSNVTRSRLMSKLCKKKVSLHPKEM